MSIKHGVESTDFDVKNTAQPNRQETGNAMQQDNELSMVDKIEDEFHQEYNMAFTFNNLEKENTFMPFMRLSKSLRATHSSQHLEWTAECSFCCIMDLKMR